MKNAYIVTDLGFGDSGKGTTVDFLTEHFTAGLNVKFNGGSQAAHNVYTPDGNNFTFSQFGSGSFHGCDTFLTKDVSVDPLAMTTEGNVLSTLIGKNVFNSMHIDENCALILPYYAMYNRFLEKSRGDAKHGSCGVGHGVLMGIIESSYLVPRVRDISNRTMFISKLNNILSILQEMGKADGFEIDTEDSLYINPIELADIYIEWLGKVTVLSNDRIYFFMTYFDTVIFEGAQGVLLDEYYGFNPNTTWSTTTNENALNFIKEFDRYNKEKLDIDSPVNVHTYGVTRTFLTRHGAGVFVSESDTDEMVNLIKDDDNSYNDWQENLRVGYMDMVMLNYAIKASKVDSIVLTHVDKLKDDLFSFVCKYDNEGSDILQIEPFKSLDSSFKLTKFLKKCRPVFQAIDKKGLLATIHNATGLQVDIISKGKTYLDKEVLRPLKVRKAA